ncbi:hypothetical protein CSOJ01_09080 [Colletotrichum sojae]|uniref:Uncharacterized protein n=1 Tax=Colletotrichum sojae TaxID=2175907 RepID=A0A8H6MS18_9PEZI|nr:hypothetical protein CSOJ01_09080 [Colletotrichum sojae]
MRTGRGTEKSKHITDSGREYLQYSKAELERPAAPSFARSQCHLGRLHGPLLRCRCRGCNLTCSISASRVPHPAPKTKDQRHVRSNSDERRDEGESCHDPTGTGTEAVKLSQGGVKATDSIQGSAASCALHGLRQGDSYRKGMTWHPRAESLAFKMLAPGRPLDSGSTSSTPRPDSARVESTRPGDVRVRRRVAFRALLALGAIRWGPEANGTDLHLASGSRCRSIPN